MGPNPSLFREMQKPYSSPEEADKQLTEFCLAVEELRAKYGVSQVLLTIAANVIYPPKGEGEEPSEGTVTTYFHIGDEMHAERMAAWTMGATSSWRQQKIAEILDHAGGIKVKKRKSPR